MGLGLSEPPAADDESLELVAEGFHAIRMRLGRPGRRATTWPPSARRSRRRWRWWPTTTRRCVLVSGEDECDQRPAAGDARPVVDRPRNHR